jgi:hypothetical protein
MKHVVQFSGGAASAWVAKWVVDKYGTENTILLFHDTKSEDVDSYRFRRQVSEYIGVSITDVSDGRDLWQVIDDNNALPSSFIPFCTRILKQEQAEKWYKVMEEQGIEMTHYNGLGIDEFRRVQKAAARAIVSGRALVMPIVIENISDAEIKRQIVEEWGICLPRAYQTLKHNNCVPCFKAGQGHFRAVWRNYPDEFAKAIAYEDKIGHTVFKDVSLKELQARWEIQTDFLDDVENNIPCMCAI